MLPLGGVKVSELIEKYNFTLNDLEPYFPITQNDFIQYNINVQYLGYYVKWDPQEAYYYSVEATDFKTNDRRTEGTYSKYNSLDDRIDGFHYWTT